MKTINIIITILLICINILAGFIFPEYQWTNIALSTSIILCNLVFSLLIDWLKLKDAYKISLYFIFSFLGIIEFILAVLAPNDLKYNGYILTIAILICIQVVMLVITNLISKIK